MRFVLAATVCVLVGVLLFSHQSGAFSYTYTKLPSNQSLQKRPYQLLSESLKKGVTAYDFLKKLSPTFGFSDYERYFKKFTVHNPLVFRQGGTYAPQPVPTGYPIAGPPFDIHTPTGTIPGCLNLLCPPPQGAIWDAGICWCTP